MLLVMNENPQQRALDALPRRLRRAMQAKDRYARFEYGPDQTCLTLMDIRHGPGEGCTLNRSVWWFEEEGDRWVLDENDEWWLPMRDAFALPAALGALIPVPA